uniref:NADH-ubiquinone oxidoreductase chain 6 n=1 Tax=Silvanus bidentatus TaxID=878982 RepID=A0A343A411_9CUCU|nr:NADH dehydrogenase subunit 6 [Silvanus bidentatus]AOY39289.1 NADH dehydrogenase subunit 6 [Silvanus bidentatus]
MIMFILMNISILFLFMKHPLSMGFILFIQVLLISLITNITTLNSWFSYILFLVMIGGMLILFIYMTSLASNEKFKFSWKILFTLFFLLILEMFLIFNFNFYDSTKINNLFMNSISMNFNKFFMFPSYLIMITIIIYLLITLIAVVKITNFKSGPLRQKFYENTLTNSISYHKNY